MAKGKLWIVPTPLGNLEDITLRALRILREADMILAEDTRTSSVLLKHFEIATPLRAYHAFNEHKILDGLIQELLEGKSFALITDAGTPGISDPGFLLVRSCIAHSVPVETLPGPTAFVPALIDSGLPAHSFTFIGFLPAKKGRQTRIREIAKEKNTMILYESPHRLLKTLEELHAAMGERRVSISRELSKKFSETLRGSFGEMTAHFTSHEPRGEFVIVIAAETSAQD